MQRYKCKSCCRTFTYSFFKLEFCEQFRKINQIILKLLVSGASNREISRIIGHSEHLIRSRIRKMARWGLLAHAKFISGIKISEPIVYDGLENFSYSQFDPNNINHAIGKESYFTYDFNFAPINRKGRMNFSQKLKKRELERKFGPYPKNILRTTTKTLIHRLCMNSENKFLYLHTDEHFQYRRAIERDLNSLDIEHHTISSKAYRNFQNPLFAVNNFDMQIRQKSAAFKRETIAFAKHSIGMIEKFILFMVFKNYMRPIFYKKQIRDPMANTQSPAMRLKLTKKILTMQEFFRTRITGSQVNLNPEWKNYFRRIDPLSRRPIKSNFTI